ncbi:MAG: type IV secretory system conjugative DNA transfer family protein [Pseudomonadota bacterium]
MKRPPKHLKPKRDYRGNLPLFGAVGSGLMTWGALPDNLMMTPLDYAVTGILATASLIGALKGAEATWQNYRLRKNWQEARTPYQDKDDSLLTEEERIKIGMREPTGRLYGCTKDGQPTFLPTNLKPHFEFHLGAQGVGKTSTQVIASVILNAVNDGMSIYINDPKKEILPQVLRFLKKLGREVICVNIGTGAEHIPTTQVPPFELAIDAYLSNDKSLYELTTTFIRGYAAIAVEQKDGDKGNPFFIENGRVAFEALLVYLLAFEPDNVTPSRIWQIASNLSLAIRCLERLRDYRARPHDTVLEYGQNAASTLLDMHQDTPKYLPQFLNKLVLGLRCFDPSGPLRNFGRDAVARISDMRKRPIIFAAMTSLATSNDLAVHASFLSFNFYNSAKLFPNGLRIHGIMDEFVTLNVPEFADNMQQLRGLGVSSENYIQSRNGLERKVGKLAADLIFDQSDVWQMSVLSYEDAKFASEVLGQETRRRYNFSIQKNDFDDIGFSGHDQKEALFTVPELMALPADQQIVKVRGFRADIQLKIKWWDIVGLRENLDDNPLEGPTPKSARLLKLKISKKGVKVCWWKKPKAQKLSQDSGPKPERLLRPSAFLWLYAWAAILLIGGFQFEKPVPHIYWERSSLGCEYISVQGERVIRPPVQCLPIWIKQGER